MERILLLFHSASIGVTRTSILAMRIINNPVITSLSPSPSLPSAIPPVLTHGELLRDQLVLSGSTVVFPCTASGAPTPTYTWTKAGLSQPININAESEGI